MAGPQLLVKLSATHAVFAYQRRQGAPLSPCASYACSDFETLWDAICHHLWQHRLPPPSACTIATPTRVEGQPQSDQVRAPYWPWSFSAQGLRSALSLERLQIVSDEVALTQTLPVASANPTARCPEALERLGAALC